MNNVGLRCPMKQVEASVRHFRPSAVIFLMMVPIASAPLACAQSVTAPNVSSVLLASGTQNGSLLNIFSMTQVPTVFGSSSFGNAISAAGNFTVVPRSLGAVSSTLSANIATALSVVPLASPASGVIFKTDPSTGVELPAAATLGPVFVERAETIGKNKFYIGITNQDFHFTSLNGQSLNSLVGLYSGGAQSSITLKSGQIGTAVPASFNMSMDVRLSQDTAFITYGATNRFDISVGLPVVHSSVAATTWDAQIYAGNGTQKLGDCWCFNTFTPGNAPSAANPHSLFKSLVGESSLGKTGFGDLLLRFKGTVVDTPNLVLALGGDLRLPTGDAQNFLGTGATSVKPFMALSLYTRRLPHDIVFSPHFSLGWQYSGKSSLAGQVQESSATSAPALPFTTLKDFLPDVLSWAAGTEVAFGRRNTLVVDILGDQIGLVHGIETLPTGNISLSGFYSPTTLQPLSGNLSGLVAPDPNAPIPRASYGQYYGAFGWKTRIAGNLVATVSFLTRFDNNGLTAKVVPVYGLGYSF